MLSKKCQNAFEADWWGYWTEKVSTVVRNYFWGKSPIGCVRIVSWPRLISWTCLVRRAKLVTRHFLTQSWLPSVSFRFSRSPYIGINPDFKHSDFMKLICPPSFQCLTDFEIFFNPSRKVSEWHNKLGYDCFLQFLSQVCNHSPIRLCVIWGRDSNDENSK